MKIIRFHFLHKAILKKFNFKKIIKNTDILTFNMSISILFNFENKIENISFIEKFSLENVFS